MSLLPVVPCVAAAFARRGSSRSFAEALRVYRHCSGMEVDWNLPCVPTVVSRPTFFFRHNKWMIIWTILWPHPIHTHTDTHTPLCSPYYPIYLPVAQGQPLRLAFALLRDTDGVDLQTLRGTRRTEGSNWVDDIPGKIKKETLKILTAGVVVDQMNVKD